MPNRIEVKPILAGLAVMFIASIVLGVLGRIFGVLIFATLVKSSDVGPAQVTAFFQSTAELIVAAAFNGAFSFGCGYVAGRLASGHGRLHGAAVGLAAVAFEWLGRSLSLAARPPLLWALLAGGVTIGCCALGGYWGARRKCLKSASIGTAETPPGSTGAASPDCCDSRRRA